MSLLVKLVGSAFVTVSAGGGIYAGVVSQSSSNTFLTSSSHSETLQEEPRQESTSLKQTQEVPQAQNTNSHPEEQVTALKSSETPTGPTQTEQELEEHNVETAEEGNCRVVTDLGKVIEGLSLTSSSYVSITCETQGIEGDDEGLSKKWTALFPKSFFTEGGERIISGRKLTIKTETDSPDDEEEEIYKTIFQSDSFSSSNEVVGRWNDGDQYYDKKLVDPVRVVSPTASERVYFVHLDDEE